MAQKPSELESENRTDPIARTAGAEADPFVEQYGSRFEVSSPESFESAGVTNDQPEETEQIKSQIEETRSQLSETIDAIQEKLSLSNVSEQVSEQVSNVIESAKNSAYEATIGKAVHFMKNFGSDISESRVFTTVKSNPLPFALIGLGAGLLAYQSYGSGKRPIRGLGKFRGGSYGTGYSGGRNLEDHAASESAGRDESLTSRAFGTASDSAGSAYSAVTGAAGTAYDSVSGAVGSAYSGAGEIASRAYKSAGEIGGKAQEQYEYYIEENPLAVGAVAMALGAAVGFAIPSTHYEGRLLGETRQNLMDKAQNAAGDLIDQAKRVAGEAGKTIKEETKSLTQ